MSDKILKQSIQRLDIKDLTIELLEKNNVTEIGKLCKTTKTDLKKMNLQQDEINKIQIELQLLGLNLKGGL